MAIIGFVICVNARNTLTFYAWKRGDITPDGSRSLTGHAFMAINNDFYGFGVSEWKVRWAWGTGVIHGDLSEYATVMITFNISVMRAARVRVKIQKWIDDEPDYVMGNTDCTTFVMDIADAAGISYGSRWSIQSPIGFMDRLRDYNQ